MTTKRGSIETNFNAGQTEVNIDPFHFSNVVLNLVDNAIKYCRKAPQITISTFNRDGNIVISVADNGIGLTKEQIGKIFDQFYRVPTGNLHDVKGFGLGLHYVKHIIEIHKGQISVKSEKDAGSTFEITLKNIS